MSYSRFYDEHAWMRGDVWRIDDGSVWTAQRQQTTAKQDKIMNNLPDEGSTATLKTTAKTVTLTVTREDGREMALTESLPDGAAEMELLLLRLKKASTCFRLDRGYE